ncbi:MAG: hypothetical protein J0H93_01730 [Chlamydiales bacterium]|nr:hypothetical protein [Chlamydiales bacterium]
MKQKLLEGIFLKSEVPILKRYKTEDSTVEKIGEILNENPNGILVHRDELSFANSRFSLLNPTISIGFSFKSCILRRTTFYSYLNVIPNLSIPIFSFLYRCHI